MRFYSPRRVTLKVKVLQMSQSADSKNILNHILVKLCSNFIDINVCSRLLIVCTEEHPKETNIEVFDRWLK